MAAQFPIYLDAHSTTPVDPLVLEEMLPYFCKHFGNAASKQHAFGWKAEEAVEKTRKKIASILGAQNHEIIFTSGATESNNLALFGLVQKSSQKGNHLIVSAIEHRSILDPCVELQKRGFSVTFLPVGASGRVDPEKVQRAITAQTILISIMAANNEIGTLQPLAEIGRIARSHKVFFHTDAAQALGKIDLNVDALSLDLVSFSAHKIYGPKGIGGLYVRQKNPKLSLHPLLLGGGHEKGWRSGTLNVPAIVGMGKALDIAYQTRSDENRRIAALRDLLWRELQGGLENIQRNGDSDHTLSNNLNVMFEGVQADALMMEMKEVAISSGSACSGVEQRPSHVLQAIGLSPEQAKRAIRFGLTRFTTEEEIHYVAGKIIASVRKLRG